MPERWTRLVFGLVALASAVAAASGAPLAGLLVALGALFAVIPIPGRRDWSMLAPGLGSLALLDAASPLVLFGLVVVGAITTLVARRSRVAEAITNGASALIAIGLIELGSAHHLIDIAGRGDLGWVEGALLAGGGVVWFLCDTLLWLVRRPQVRRSYRHETARLFSDWRIAIALVTAAVTTAVVWEYSPPWALVTALAPLAVARNLAAQAMRHEQLVELTVEALGRLPEAAGVAQQGHAVSVADLAVGMGRVAGIAGRELEELRTAALLHDAGLVEATRPEVGQQGFTTGDVARWGTDLLATDEEFLAERSIIAAVADPYRRPGADPDPGADPRAQIIKVACRFRLVTETHPENDALEHMYEEAAYSYDPSVIALVRPGLGLIDSRPREAVR